MLTIRRLSLDDALVLIKAAEAKAAEMGIPMNIAIADDGGHLIAFHRMDGARVSSAQIAIDKAFTAGTARKATHEYNAAAVPGSLAFGINTSHGGRFCTVGGGFPVEAEGEYVGAIGISGGKPDEDMVVAEAALEAFRAQLGG